MNPEMIEIARRALDRDYDVLILTNAMRPMMRRRMREGLTDLKKKFGDKLTLRISVDHWSELHHDISQRGRSVCDFRHGTRLDQEILGERSLRREPMLPQEIPDIRQVGKAVAHDSNRRQSHRF